MIPTTPNSPRISNVPQEAVISRSQSCDVSHPQSSKAFHSNNTVNCGFLWGFKLEGSDPSLVEELTGLCQPILQIANRIEEFTFTSDSKLVDDRRKIQCPDSTCLDPTKDLNKALNRRGLQLQCDEFPWASTEQGGDWLPSNMRSQTCVPSWQNNWHGQCVSKYSIFISASCALLLTIQK